MKVCFTSFVFGNYQKYIPFYIYSIARTYPNAYVRVFYDGFLENKINDILLELKKSNVASFEVIELKDASINEFEKYKIKGGGKKLVRWLFDSSNFKGFDFVYFGDVDILILPEEISLMDLHIAQMKRMGLPFSNKVRVDANGIPVKRLTGLHFIETENYFLKIDPIVKRIKSDVVFRKQFLEDVERDETLLYKINKEAFSFDDKKLIEAERPWHGMHLGITRGNNKMNIKTIEENSSLTLEEIKRNLIKFLDDKLFKKIQKKVFVIELYVILKSLEIKIPFKWEIKAKLYDLKVNFKALKRKIKSIIDA